MPHYTWFMCSWEVNLGLHAHAYLVSTLATETQPQLHGAPPLGHCSGENLAVILNPGHDSKPSALGSWAGHLLGPLFLPIKWGHGSPSCLLHSDGPKLTMSWCLLVTAIRAVR